ncbi:putative starch synthase 4, chloroplastic/amyloplastic [Castilleja foliolosa]|uniref:starch synthase n=1 Tax=Castilleja foliolosa TaxID=1961234 RepID=A0ABD3BI24_9LAMI
MESTLSTCFLGRGLVGAGIKRSNVILRLNPSSSRRLYPASYKMRQRNFSLHSKKQQPKKINIGRRTNTNLRTNGDTKDIILDSNQEIASNDIVPVILEDGVPKEKGENNSSTLNDVKIDSVDSAGELSQSKDESATITDGGEQAPDIHLQDLIGMIREAENNIYLLNQARVRALEDLKNIIGEKESLQGEINSLEMKLAKTDARLKMAAQDKIHTDLLEDQLENLRSTLSSRTSNEQKLVQDTNGFASSAKNSNLVESLSQEVETLRAESVILKDELQFLKGELSTIRDTDQRVKALEEERSFLEGSLKELESKLAASHEDISKLSSLKSECKSLYEKVGDLQKLLDRATKQGDQAIQVLQQNQELRKKVDSLEESLNEANAYKMSSEKMQQYNELMQQKIKLLEESLQKSDEEIISYVNLYQDSMKEFQETLNILKEESKKRAEDETVNEKPRVFWSNLLLMVDGWFLEKKISVDQVKALREMVWNKEESICEAYLAFEENNESEIISAFLKLTSPSMGARLHVIHISAEMAPVAKVGGLGDVVTGLGKALQKKGHLVEIVLPKYDCMNYDLIDGLKALDVPVESYFDGRLYKNKIWVGTVEGLPVYFIEPHHPSKFFWRGQHYGEHDDFKRFSYFSRAALELILQAAKKPDIIHCHDWQTAFVAPLYWDIYVPKGLNSARICFTCHNFEYQGAAAASDLASCGLDVYHLNRPDRMQDNSAHHRVNPVKGAIVFSNIVTTVSPTYAQEVRTAELGRRLNSTLDSHSKKFIGILNGIDTEAWDPATDPLLEAHYSANDIEGKAENKEALRRHLGLSSANIRQPLVACITRLVPQKGVHLIRHAIYRTLELGGQFVLLGSSPVEQIQREFEEICNHFKTHDHARLILKYDESLSHLIYAASDMFIIPSIFEPCGLTQMIAMRYGSIPIARKTGGLNDSVFDIDDDTIPVQFRNGFTFLTANEQGLNNGLERAFYHYNNDIDGWKQLVLKDMCIDFSWDTSASLYEELYQKSVARARAAIANRI